MAANRFERSKEGLQIVGEKREFVIEWTTTPDGEGWHWRGIGRGTDQYTGGPFDTSTDAYRAALMILG